MKVAVAASNGLIVDKTWCGMVLRLELVCNAKFTCVAWHLPEVKLTEKKNDGRWKL